MVMINVFEIFCKEIISNEKLVDNSAEILWGGGGSYIGIYL